MHIKSESGHYRSYQNDLKQISRRNDNEIKYDEPRVPKLQEVIDKWKFEIQTENINLDKSLMLSVNSDNDKDVTLTLFRFSLTI